MAPYASRLRRAISISSSLFLHYSSIKTHSLNPSTSRFFSSTNTSTSSPPRSLPNAAGDISPVSILFEGCDFNHWLIVVDFPKHPKPSSQQMLNFYEQSAAKIFGSLEEAKKKIYACCTTAYTGFQVECSEETSEKFKDLDGVTFVLPDSYIDPVTKEYGGDKYIDGQIIPRPPANKYGRLGPRRDLKGRPYAREQTEGESQNYGPPGTRPTRQNFGPPRPQKNHVEASRAHQNYGPPQNFPQQKYGSHSQRFMVHLEEGLIHRVFKEIECLQTKHNTIKANLTTFTLEDEVIDALCSKVIRV